MKPLLRVEPARVQAPLDSEQYHVWAFPDGGNWAVFHRVGRDYLVRFPGLADFLMAANGIEVTCTPHPDCDDATVEHLFSNQIEPLVQSHIGKAVFHGSAVLVDDGAIGFIGSSGRGKSTLAASFSTNGGRLLADDGLIVVPDGEAHFVQPNSASVRLWDDTREALLPANNPTAPAVVYTEKQRYLAGMAFELERVPARLRALFFLRTGDTTAISIERMDSSDAMVALVQHCFLLDREDRLTLSRQFENASRIARATPCFELDYPRSYAELANVRGAIRVAVNAAAAAPQA